MTPDEVVRLLQQLGISGYEAKAYTALVAAGAPLNGYEVAKRSGVPRSTVYETLSKLVARGAAFEVRSGGDSTGYVPLPPTSLLDRMTRDFDDSVSALREALPAMVVRPQVALMHNLVGRQALLERSSDVIAGARAELFLSVWPEELAVLRPLTERAAARRVDVNLLTFGDGADPIGHTYVHEFSPPDVVLENLGCRLFVAVADRTHAVVGGFVGTDTGGDAWGVYTDNPAVVTLAVEYVRHDVAMQLIAHHFEAEGVHEFWADDPEIARLRGDRGAPAAALRGGAKQGTTRAGAARPAAGRGRRRARPGPGGPGRVADEGTA